jgi:hypothetical protein
MSSPVPWMMLAWSWESSVTSGIAAPTEVNIRKDSAATRNHDTAATSPIACPVVAATDVSGLRRPMIRQVPSTMKSRPTPIAEKISTSTAPL